jgi:DNA-binding IscR family transcriptional regulator
MSDSQRFPVAAHALAYLAHKGAFSPQAAVSSAELACSVPTNPVVVRRTTALLAKAGLIGTRTGAGGGAWLMRPAENITLDLVLKAVHGCAHLGAPPPGAQGCPVGERIPKAVQCALDQVDRAARECLSRITVADLLRGEDADVAA